MHALEGRTAFITGGASGIGRAMAGRFAREGMAVAIADRDGEAAERATREIAEAGGRALAVRCDVTDPKSIAAAADLAEAALGPVRLLCNNAGGFMLAPLESCEKSEWEWLLELNVIGVVNGLEVFLPRMRALGEPCQILNTASVSGHIPTPGLSIYTASKFAVVGLSECLRMELMDTNVDVAVLCPGIVRTGLMDTSAEHRPDTESARSAESRQLFDSVIAQGTDPEPLAEQVVDGLRRGDFYIFTHPGLRPAFERRFREILEAYPEAWSDEGGPTDRARLRRGG